MLTDLKHNHCDTAKHIAGSIVVDEHHLTKGQLLAKAREFFGLGSVSKQGNGPPGRSVGSRVTG